MKVSATLRHVWQVITVEESNVHYWFCPLCRSVADAPKEEVCPERKKFVYSELAKEYQLTLGRMAAYYEREKRRNGRAEHR